MALKVGDGSEEEARLVGFKFNGSFLEIGDLELHVVVL